MQSLILRLDISGQPIAWVPWQDAVCLYTKDRVAWTAGDSQFTFHGGVCRRTGLRSEVSISSIIAVRGTHIRLHNKKRVIPPLTNRELFLRDGYLCMYCGRETPERQLTRDHVVPLSRGGKDRWANVVTACRSCNNAKSNQTPEQARMQLLAVPFIPNWAEYLALTNRKILADQMGFLRSQFGRNSRLHDMQ